jgi:hypothetical protein
MTFEQALTTIYDQCEAFHAGQVSATRAVNDLRRVFPATMKTCVGGTLVIARAFSEAEQSNFRSRLPYPFNLNDGLRQTGVNFGRNAYVRGFYITAFALIEVTLRGLARHAGGDAEAQFWKIREIVRSSPPSDPGMAAEFQPLDALLKLMATYRNTIHNNGHHSKASETISWNSVSYQFDQGKQPVTALNDVLAAKLVGEAVAGTFVALGKLSTNLVEWPVDVVIA